LKAGVADTSISSMAKTTIAEHTIKLLQWDAELAALEAEFPQFADRPQIAALRRELADEWKLLEELKRLCRILRV
jgi:hypothetical protein